MAKDKNKGGGLGAAVRQVGTNLSAKETMQIAKQTGASAAQIFARAQQQGVGIGSAAINKFNAGKLGTNFGTQVDGPYGISYNPRADAKTTQALSQLGAIRNLRMQPGTSYMGYSTTATPTQTQYNPIVLPKELLRTMGIGGGQIAAGPYDNMNIPFTGQAAGGGPLGGPIAPQQQTTSGGMNGEPFDFKSYIDELMTGFSATQRADMEDMLSGIDTRFNELSSQIGGGAANRLQALGKSYADTIRAQQRQRKGRKEYRRGMSPSPMAQSAGNALAIGSLGGGLTL